MIRKLLHFLTGGTSAEWERKLQAEERERDRVLRREMVRIERARLDAAEEAIKNRQCDDLNLLVAEKVLANARRKEEMDELQHQFNLTKARTLLNNERNSEDFWQLYRNLPPEERKAFLKARIKEEKLLAKRAAHQRERLALETSPAQLEPLHPRPVERPPMKVVNAKGSPHREAEPEVIILENQARTTHDASVYEHLSDEQIRTSAFQMAMRIHRSPPEERAELLRKCEEELSARFAPLTVQEVMNGVRGMLKNAG